MHRRRSEGKHQEKCQQMINISSMNCFTLNTSKLLSNISGIILYKTLDKCDFHLAVNSG